MPRWTITMSERASGYIRRKVQTSRGVGAYLSELLVIEEMKEQARDELARETAASLQEQKPRESRCDE